MQAKFRIIMIIALVIVMLSTTTAFSAVKDAGIMVYLDGNSMRFEVPPVIENGTTLVPMRNVLELFGYDFDWEPELRRVIIIETLGELHHRVTTLTIDSTKVTQHEAMGYYADDKVLYTKDLNHVEYNLANPARLINGRTMVPLRFIAEMSGYEVAWDPGYRIVKITSPDYIPNTISDEQKAINDQYVELSDEPADSAPGAFQ
jgi:hypothetical protein